MTEQMHQQNNREFNANAAIIKRKVTELAYTAYGSGRLTPQAAKALEELKSLGIDTGNYDREAHHLLPVMSDIINNFLIQIEGRSNEES